MKLSDPSFLNMDKILKNLSDIMKKPPPKRCRVAGGAKSENGTAMAEIKFARESVRKKGKNAAPSGPKLQARMRRSNERGAFRLHRMRPVAWTP